MLINLFLALAALAAMFFSMKQKNKVAVFICFAAFIFFIVPVIDAYFLADEVAAP